MGQTYENAEGVETIAQQLIGSHHPELATARFRFVFKEKAGKKGGKTVYGTVKKCSDLMIFLIGADYLMEVALDAWNPLDGAKRTALVDHLLERCLAEDDEESGETTFKLREPDVQEFSSILRRHGTWNDDLVNFVSVAQSLDLSYMTAGTQTATATTTQTTSGAQAH
jgi:hypothetical protein